MVKRMEIHRNTIMENLQHFTHHPVEVLLQLQITTFRHPIIIRATCIPVVTTQVMSTAAFNLQITTTISHLHIQCRIIIIQIIMILNCRMAACIKTLMHHTTRVIIHIQLHLHHQQAFHRRRLALTIINGIISNLSL